MSTDAVSCMSWVKRGVAKENPDRVKLTAEELKELIRSQEKKLRNLGIEDFSDDEAEEAKDENPAPGTKRKHASEASIENNKGDDPDFDDIVDKYDLDNYEDDADDDNDQSVSKVMGDLAVFSSFASDPLNAMQDDSDEEDLVIKATDNMLAVGRIKGSYCVMEAHVYNEEESSFFCHHDVLLPSFPLALEWLDYDPADPGTPSNLVAMGTMEPDIEIWDLDLIDSLEPACVLQGMPKKSKLKKKKGNIMGHSDAVLDLSWNARWRKALASASADSTIGLWDLQNGVMVTSITKHTDKVQTLQWHPVEETLISGSFDSTVKVYDCKNPNDSFKSWDVKGEVEKVLWNHHNPFYFFAANDSGDLYMFDVRSDKKVAKVQAHGEAVTGLTLCSSMNCLVTVSTDKRMKIWDAQKGQIKLISEKKMNMGEIHSAAMSPDSRLVVAVGGEIELRMVNLARNPAVAKHFGLDSDLTEDNDELAADAGDDTDEEVMQASGVKPKKAIPKKKKKKGKSKKNF